MAFFLRKALKFGPLRLNLSKSGAGMSVGVTGARVGIRPDGQTYVFGGRHGLYYRETVGSVADDPGVDRGAVADVIAGLLDRTADTWLPAVRMLHNPTGTESEKSKAAETLHQHTLMIRDELRAQGFSTGPDREFSEVISRIHSELLMERAFPEHYEAWNSACDALLRRAAKEGIRVAKKHQVEALTRLANQEPATQVINDLAERVIVPHLKSKGLILEDNPVYAMRLGSAVHDAILTEVSDLLAVVPDDRGANQDVLATSTPQLVKECTECAMFNYAGRDECQFCGASIRECSVERRLPGKPD